MPSITREEYAQLQAKASAPVTEGWKHGVLTVFVAGTPTHFKGKGHRFTVSKHTRDWRERTAMKLFPHRRSGVSYRYESGGYVAMGHYISTGPWPWPAEAPKAITFTVYTSGRGFDGPENLRLVCSPCLDALGMPRAYVRKGREVGGHGMGLIDDDKNPAHAITYDQIVKATMPGIAIRIELAR